MNPLDFPVNQPTDEVILSTPVDILTSFFYYRNINMAEIRSWGTRIIGDSGAYSAMSTGTPVDRDEFHAWAKKWKDALYWVAALDMIGDPKGTYANWKAAQREGLDLVPTIHYGEPPETMNQYVDQGVTFLGLGGMVPYKSEPKRLMRWCLSMHIYARDNHPDVRFHGWGTTHSAIVDGLPWWSVDSSGFGSAFRFGVMKLFDPTAGRNRSVPLDGRSIAKYARLLRTHYGADWRNVARSEPANRREVARVALRAQQLHAQRLQQRRAVTPPPRFKGDGPGPLLAAADATFATLLDPGHGPKMVAADSDIKPDWDNPEKTQRGPLISAAMGSPAMQPHLSLDPGDPLARPKEGTEA